MYLIGKREKEKKNTNSGGGGGGRFLQDGETTTIETNDKHNKLFHRFSLLTIYDVYVYECCCCNWVDAVGVVVVVLFATK